MRRKRGLRLPLMFLIVGTFVSCLLLAPSPKLVQATFVSCATCTTNHNTALTNCDIARDNCKANCVSTGGGAWGDVPSCQAACENTWNQCTFNAGMGETNCFLTCTPGSGGGGTGGGLTKTPCVNACYAQRTQCFGNQGIPDAEDCINEGTAYPICCYNQFQDCLAGC